MSIYHKHHIIPRHMGGTDDPSNLVELTVEEHAEAHRKLFEQYGHWQDELAWKGLSGSIGKEEIILTKIVKANLGRIDSEETRKKKSEAQKRIGNIPPSALGRKDTESTKQKKTLSRIGKKASPDTIEKLRKSHMGQKAWNIGIPHSVETRNKISIASSNPSEETRRKMSKAKIGNTNKLGKRLSEKSKQLMSSVKKGILTGPCSEEKKANIGKARVGKRWYKNIDSTECVCCYPGQEPVGWIPGMVKK